MSVHKVSTQIGELELSIETGKLAKQANGSVVVRYGDMTLLAAATLGNVREGDFFPLTVDLEIKTYAAGRIPVTFPRREGRPPDRSTLIARMTDRPLRPLFPDGMRNEVQIVVTTLSTQPDGIPDTLCALAASAALTISDIPFDGPVGSVRVGWLEETGPILNPTYEQLAESKLDLMMAGTQEAIVMVEAGAKEVSRADMLTALEFGHAAIKQICAIQLELRELCGKPKTEVPLPVTDEALKAKVRELMAPQWRGALGAPGKAHHYSELKRIGKETVAALLEDEANAGKEAELKRYTHDIESEVVREMILREGIRSDGRDCTTVRPIACEVQVLPRVHGTGLFTRGETQVLSVATLGTVGDRKTTDWLNEQYAERYFHHYNFPPYSVGECKRMGSVGRREIGHGMLAQRALMPVLPTEEEFPYTMRVVSEVLESNGSSSMASTCGSTLALLDAGVPLKAPVAGVAMGLLKDGDNYKIITDILGLEDHCGDMDFKVCGTANGITALQMDIKCDGLTREIMEEALNQAEAGLEHIRGEMAKVMSTHRETLSPFAPNIEVLHIDPEKIGTVIGPGGKMIKKIQEESGARIDIEQDGRVFVAAPDAASGKIAADWIRGLTHEARCGEEYDGKVTRIFGFGAMVEILPGKEGLVHISKLAAERIGRVEDVVSIGDPLKVRVTEIDDQGRINLERTDIPIIVNLGEDGERRNPAPRDGDRGPRRDDRGPRRDDRGGRGGDRGGRGGGGGGDRGPRRDDRGPRRDDRGPRPDGGGDRGPRPERGNERPRSTEEGSSRGFGYGDDSDRPAPRGQRERGPEGGQDSGPEPGNEA